MVRWGESLSLTPKERVYLHTVGTPISKDTELFGFSPGTNLSVCLSPNGRWLAIMKAHSRVSTEIYLIDCSNEAAPPIPLFGTTTKTRVSAVVPCNDAVFLLTTYDLKDGTNSKTRFHVLSVDPTSPQEKNWREVVPESMDVCQDIAVYNKNLVLDYVHDVHSVLRVHDQSDG